MKDIWKKYDEAEPSHSTAHHLMAIHQLLKRNGYARGIDVAKYLNITRGSVSLTLTKLKDKNYVLEDANKFYRLTEQGEQIVNSVLCKRHAAQLFLREALQLPEEIAEFDACKIEHLLSHKTGEKLLVFMEYFLSDKPEAQKFRDGLLSFQHSCNPRTGWLCESDTFLQ